MTAEVTAVVLLVEPRAKGAARLILRPVRLSAYEGAMPARIRVTAQRLGGYQGTGF